MLENIFNNKHASSHLGQKGPQPTTYNLQSQPRTQYSSCSNYCNLYVQYSGVDLILNIIPFTNDYIGLVVYIIEIKSIF